MNTNGICQRHWFFVALHFGVDTAIVIFSFLLGMQFRFGPEWQPALGTYWPGLLLGSFSFSCAAYVCNLYSRRECRQSLLKRTTLIAFCHALAMLVMMFLFYVNFSTRIGRGVMTIAVSASFFGICLHHAALLRRWKGYRERVALVVGSAADEAESRFLTRGDHDQLEVIGIFLHRGYVPESRLRVLGTMDDIAAVAQKENLTRVLCTNRNISDPSLRQHFCQLRYSGIVVMPLVSVCEEIYQCVPVELVTQDWLLHASGLPHMLYIRKLKRGFDVVASIAGLFLLGPVALLGMALIKLTSPGPVFFRQKRVGRFGRLFEIVKLRTMAVDAEKGGAIWASQNDPRVTRIGSILRKYRIDEIPQLINVFRGEMSFVGPRPERPEFMDELASQIPFFRERLMVQPGITGWAQVNYPYGASIDDARRKLEYDLYYTKHMSIFVDVFSLLDTVRIILSGGIQTPQAGPWQKFQEAGIPVSFDGSPRLGAA